MDTEVGDNPHIIRVHPWLIRSQDLAGSVPGARALPTVEQSSQSLDLGQGLLLGGALLCLCGAGLVRRGAGLLLCRAGQFLCRAGLLLCRAGLFLCRAGLFRH